MNDSVVQVLGITGMVYTGVAFLAFALIKLKTARCDAQGINLQEKGCYLTQFHRFLTLQGSGIIGVFLALFIFSIELLLNIVFQVEIVRFRMGYLLGAFLNTASLLWVIAESFFELRIFLGAPSNASLEPSQIKKLRLRVAAVMVGATMYLMLLLWVIGKFHIITQ